MNVSPKVLIISHNVLGGTSAMGKTLSSMLDCISPTNLAQLYFHSEIPTVNLCRNYFRITDTDMLRSILNRQAKWTHFKSADVQMKRQSSRTDKGLLAGIYQFSRRRTPTIYFLRNLLWKIGKWNSAELQKWVEDFNPDVIFFASGDYSFSYRIAYTIAMRNKIPIILWCCDDYYFSRRFRKSPMGAVYRKNLMRWLEKVAKHTCEVVVISDKMKTEYSKLFSQPIHIMRISSLENPYALPVSQRSGIVYTGNLGVNRLDSLLELGRVLHKKLIPGFEHINVYSNEKSEKVLACLTEENGICFHGSLSAEGVQSVLGSAKFVVHIEAFDEKAKNRTRYSLSTKIGDYLRSGACILAYGPGDISSMEYLAGNRAAAMLRDADSISRTVSELHNDPVAYRQYVSNAQKLAEENHNKQRNDDRMREIFQDASPAS